MEVEFTQEFEDDLKSLTEHVHQIINGIDRSQCDCVVFKTPNGNMILTKECEKHRDHSSDSMTNFCDE